MSMVVRCAAINGAEAMPALLQTIVCASFAKADVQLRATTVRNLGGMVTAPT
jgi:hypothetical protein